MMIQMGDNYLFELICNACSQNPVNVKDAESKLQEAEKQPGYCLSLLVKIVFFLLVTKLYFIKNVFHTKSFQESFVTSDLSFLKRECEITMNVI